MVSAVERLRSVDSIAFELRSRESRVRTLRSESLTGDLLEMRGTTRVVTWSFGDNGERGDGGGSILFGIGACSPCSFESVRAGGMILPPGRASAGDLSLWALLGTASTVVVGFADRWRKAGNLVDAWRGNA